MKLTKTITDAANSAQSHQRLLAERDALLDMIIEAKEELRQLRYDLEQHVAQSKVMQPKPRRGDYTKP